MEDGPSLKVKFDEELTFATHPCVEAEYCPRASTVNAWKTKKVTLNNMVQGDGEVEAYREFRKYMAAPMAEHTTLSLYRGSALFSKTKYAMVETVDDKAFLKKHFGANYTLHEIEYNQPYFERAGGALQEDDVSVDLLNIPLESIHREHAMQYYALELATRHWDGACSRDFKNNYFVVYNGRQNFIVPWGLDQTFQYCSKAGTASKPTPRCLFMQQCFESSSCKIQFDGILNDVRRNVRAEGDCMTRHQVVELSLFSFCGAMGLFCLSLLVQSLPWRTEHQTPATPPLEYPAFARLGRFRRGGE
jgi:hypothetical protein